MNNHKAISFQVSNRKVAAMQWGDDEAPVILALHGWLDNAASFSFLGPYLENYRFIAMDFTGHGLSDHLPEGVLYNFIDYVFELENIISSLDVDRVILLGHSMGGAVASILAGVRPNSVDKLILLDAFGPLVSEPKKTAKQISIAIGQKQILQDREIPMYPNFDDLVQRRLALGDLERHQIMPLMERGITKIGSSYTWNTDPRLKITSPVKLQEEEVQEIFKSISATCLLIEASHGLPKLETFINKRIEFIGDCRRIKMDGGHHIHIEQAKLVSEKISEFLSSTD